MKLPVVLILFFVLSAGHCVCDDDRVVEKSVATPTELISMTTTKKKTPASSEMKRFPVFTPTRVSSTGGGLVRIIERQRSNSPVTKATNPTTTTREKQQDSEKAVGVLATANDGGETLGRAREQREEQFDEQLPTTKVRQQNNEIDKDDALATKQFEEKQTRSKQNNDNDKVDNDALATTATSKSSRGRSIEFQPDSTTLSNRVNLPASDQPFLDELQTTAETRRGSVFDGNRFSLYNRGVKLNKRTGLRRSGYNSVQAFPAIATGFPSNVAPTFPTSSGSVPVISGGSNLGSQDYDDDDDDFSVPPFPSNGGLNPSNGGGSFGSLGGGSSSPTLIPILTPTTRLRTIPTTTSSLATPQSNTRFSIVTAPTTTAAARPQTRQLLPQIMEEDDLRDLDEYDEELTRTAKTSGRKQRPLSSSSSRPVTKETATPPQSKIKAIRRLVVGTKTIEPPTTTALLSRLRHRSKTRFSEDDLEVDHTDEEITRGGSDDGVIRDFLFTDIRCFRTPSKEYFGLNIHLKSGYHTPYIRDRPSDPMTTECRMTKLNSNYKMSITDLRSCGVEVCANNELCLTLVFPRHPTLALLEDEVTTIRCKPQSNTIAETRSISFQGDSLDNRRSSSTVEGGTEEFAAEVGIFRQSDSGLFMKRVNSGGVVKLGESLQLRSVIRSGDGWSYSRLTDVKVWRMREGYKHKTSLNPTDATEVMTLVDSRGCRNSDYKLIAGDDPSSDPRNDLVNHFTFKAFLFRGQRAGEPLIITARVVGCREECEVGCSEGGQRGRSLDDELLMGDEPRGVNATGETSAGQLETTPTTVESNGTKEVGETRDGADGTKESAGQLETRTPPSNETKEFADETKEQISNSSLRAKRSNKDPKESSIHNIVHDWSTQMALRVVGPGQQTNEEDEDLFDETMTTTTSSNSSCNAHIITSLFIGSFIMLVCCAVGLGCAVVGCGKKKRGGLRLPWRRKSAVAMEGSSDGEQFEYRPSTQQREQREQRRDPALGSRRRSHGNQKPLPPIPTATTTAVVETLATGNGCHGDKKKSRSSHFDENNNPTDGVSSSEEYDCIESSEEENDGRLSRRSRRSDNNRRRRRSSHHGNGDENFYVVYYKGGKKSARSLSEPPSSNSLLRRELSRKISRDGCDSSSEELGWRARTPTRLTVRSVKSRSSRGKKRVAMATEDKSSPPSHGNNNNKNKEDPIFDDDDSGHSSITSDLSKSTASDVWQPQLQQTMTHLVQRNGNNTTKIIILPETNV